MRKQRITSGLKDIVQQALLLSVPFILRLKIASQILGLGFRGNSVRMRFLGHLVVKITKNQRINRVDFLWHCQLSVYLSPFAVLSVQRMFICECV